MSQNKQERVKYPRPPDFIPETTFPEGHSKAGRPRCQGWNRNVGRQCGNSPLKGRKFCRVHGGRTKQGKDHPNYTTGIYSEAMPRGLRGKLHEVYANPELMNMRNDVSLITLRIDQMLERLSTGESGSKWDDINNLYNRAMQAIRDNDTQTLIQSLQQIGGVLSEGADEEEIWAQVRSLVIQRTGIIEKDQNLAIRIGEVISLHRVYELIVGIATDFRNIITRRVDDPEIVKSIVSEITRATESRLS